MHSVLRSIATVGLAVLFLAVTTIVSAAGSDKEFMEMLVTSSPWVGTFGYGENGREAGSITISFSSSGDTLKGEVTSFSGRGTAKPGPLDKVELKDGQLSFVTPSNGVYQEMRLEDGKLKGHWHGRSAGWLLMSPSKH